MAVVSWNEIVDEEKNAGSGGSNKYMRLAGNNTYTVRPVGKPVMFFKYFHSFGGRFRSGVCENPKTCPVGAKYPDLDKPRKRYAINVIDRADGVIKILEAGPKVFRGFMAWYQMSGKSPGGKEGGDFGIVVKGTGRNTEYGVSFLEGKPFAEEELELIKEGVYDLEQEFKALGPDELEQKLFGEEDSSGGGNAPKSSGAEGGKSDTPASGGGGDDDDFSSW